MALSRRTILKTFGTAGLAYLPLMALASACAPAAPPTSAPAKPAEPAPQSAAPKPATDAAKPAEAPKPAAAATTAPAAAKPPTTGGAKVTLTFSHYLDPAAAKVYESIIQSDFQQKFPNADVKIDISPEGEFIGKMLTQMGGGNFSDIVMVTDRYMPDFASRDVLLDMNPNIKRDDAAYELKDLNEDLVQAGGWEGKQVAIYDYTGPYVLYYNKRLFKEAGVEPPKESGLNTTWDEFTEMLKKLTRGEGEKKIWGAEALNSGFHWQISTLESYGGRLTDHRGPAPADKVNFHYTPPEVKKAMQMQTDWVLKDKSVPGPGAVQGDAFTAQRVAVKLTGGRYLIPTYSALPWAEDIGMLHSPLGTTKRLSRNGPRGLMIPKGSKNQDQAWDFIRFFTDKAGMQLLFKLNYSTPARKSLWDAFAKTLPKWEDIEIYRRSQQAMSELGALPTYPKWAKANKIITDNVNALWLGQMPLDDGMKKIETELNAEMKAP
jgi:multiple sugar transport system substrate-binding protein